MSVMGASATAHGKQLLELGYTVDQVVHDYGDICQAITDLAVERDAPFSVNEFRTLNRCLDNAIADAVTEFSARRDTTLCLKHSADENQAEAFWSTSSGITSIQRRWHTARWRREGLRRAARPGNC